MQSTLDMNMASKLLWKWFKNDLSDKTDSQRGEKLSEFFMTNQLKNGIDFI